MRGVEPKFRTDILRDMKSFCIRHSLALILSLSAAGAVAAQPDAPVATTTTQTTQTTVETPTRTTTETTTTTREKIVDTGRQAGKIATQPVRDVGAEKV